MTAQELKILLIEKIDQGTLDPGEPVFMLRAKDKLAPEIVRQWANSLRWETGPSKKVEQALEVAQDMRMWQLTNGVKVPD